jgi:magnesium chelatase family protein
MGLLPENKPLLTTRPFRAPHHTISDAGLIGGGQIPKPGEVSLAHNGVLFLDESPEFKKNVLEVLRQPLEDGTVTIARAAHSLSFPASFIMIAALNPCPCGYLGDVKHNCTCTPAQIHRYETRLSGPLLDRIDLHLEVPAVRFQEMTQTIGGESSAAIKKRVDRARQVQVQRYRRHRKIHCNGQMGTREIKKYCQLDQPSQELIEAVVERLGLSARSYHRILKIARTIADLAESPDILSAHMAEAVQYRRLDRR